MLSPLSLANIESAPIASSHLSGAHRRLLDFDDLEFRKTEYRHIDLFSVENSQHSLFAAPVTDFIRHFCLCEHRPSRLCQDGVV